MTVTQTTVNSILTRTTGFLKPVSSHSLQPYRGCSFGSSLCGVGCYVRHNRPLTRGAAWGSFLEARVNAAEAYSRQWRRERDWGRRSRGRFSVFLSSSTEPFLPQEDRFQVTRRVLEAMRERPPDLLILQTHTHRVAAHVDLLGELSERCELRVHISVESDRDRLPGLPPPASPVERRLQAAARLQTAGLAVVITVAPLLPVVHPEKFFRRLGEVAGTVVIDHFIGGDGTIDGRRTRATPLPAVMSAVDRDSISLAYRDQMLAVARRILPGRVGVGADGFAGRLLPAGGVPA